MYTHTHINLAETQREMQAERLRLIGNREQLTDFGRTQQNEGELDVWIPRTHRVWM